MAPIPTRLKLEATALNRPAVRQPARRQGSVRRTSSLQSLWTPGEDSRFTIVGRARDLVTLSDRDPAVIGEDGLEAVIGPDGRISALDGSRLGNRLAQFAGLRPGGELRKAMARDIADEAARETRLHRLLDDLAGAVFMSVAAWYAWEGGIKGHADRLCAKSVADRPVTGICLSYVPGSPSMTADGRGAEENADHPIGPLPLATADPFRFHALAETDGPNQWRLRRTDLWREGGELVADAWFQDSSAIEGDPGRRLIFHEYGLTARFDPASLEIAAISVTPHVLPYVTCHAAPATAEVLLGRNVRDLRGLVPSLLRGEAGCTHLNDMLRALQDVAALAGVIGMEGADGNDAGGGSIAD